jgi:hypothetical protein
MPAGAYVARSVVQPSTGATINYKVGVPAGATAGLPMVVMIGGTAERGNDNVSQLNFGLAPVVTAGLAAGTWASIAIAPQIPNSGNGAADLLVGYECIPLMIAAAIAEWGCDGARCGLSGSSYGGSLAFGLMAQSPQLFSCLVTTPGLIILAFFTPSPSFAALGSDAACGAAAFAAYGQAPVRMFTGNTDGTYTPAQQNTTAAFFTGSGATRFGQRGGNGLLPFVSDHASTPANAFADGTVVKWMYQQRRVDATHARSYDYVKPIVIDHTKVGGAAVTGYIAKIAGTDADMKSTGNGGQSTSASGFDHAYFLDSALTERLLAELTTVFNPATGKYEDYVNLGTSALSTVADQTVYMGLGNPAVTLSQSDALASVWGANAKEIGHGGDGSAVVLTDSSGSGNDLTNVGLTATTDATGGALASNGTSQNADRTTAVVTTEPATLEIVFNPVDNTINSTLLGLSLNTPFSPPVIMEIQKRAGGTVRATRGDGIAGTAPFAASVGVYTPGVENYAAAVFTSTSARSIQINASADVADATANSAAAAMDRTYLLGRHLNSVRSNWTNGSACEWRIWNIAKSRAWRDTTYNDLVARNLLSIGAATPTQGVSAGGGGGGTSVRRRLSLAVGLGL